MNNGNGLEALMEKEKALRERIAKAKAEQMKRAAAQRKALAQILGGALIDAETIPPEVKSAITAILAAAGLEDRARKILKQGGWL
jgi:predicted enzyme related to lactoylglutathione lyase